ncbi:DotH/IcmK family type IV secretion protein [Alteromonas sp. 14N.309.X.WAT.G.H12]|uniref:DotH/IcmK family type IV secretion protein n=1 Tax=Alteromonas sp. 14N.309.X.WAT.G.H12 TaxID=3120824 RepID=UPI002FD44B81
MTLRLNISVLLTLLTLLMLWGSNANAARKEEELKPPRYYTERAKTLLDGLVAKDLIDKVVPLSDSELQDYKEELRLEDRFKYDPDPGLIEDSRNISINPRSQRMVEIKLGHTFNTTITFTDAMGNPWSYELLSDISNKDVVSAKKAMDHILTVRPQKLAGKTNIPIMLAGQTTPLTLIFDISNEEVYMNVNIQVEGVGDSIKSQQRKATSSYRRGDYVEPKLTTDPVKEKMLLFLNPEGYQQRQLVDEYGNEVDYRDYVAWTNDDKLYIITPHDAFHPQPIDITSSPDGQHLLFEYDLVPVVTMEQGNKTVMLYVK